MTKSTLPHRLYKYRAFNVNTLRLLSEAEVYYADPADFNDPLDCSPTIEIDTDRSSLEKLCYKMLLATNGADTAKRLLNEPATCPRSMEAITGWIVRRRSTTCECWPPVSKVYSTASLESEECSLWRKSGIVRLCGVTMRTTTEACALNTSLRKMPVAE